ncbi:LamG domain-containing protein [Patescibacteria group bacterium]|nr:MAG: LamG domain-containing protein [Patescibacteria group bacterium]
MNKKIFIVIFSTILFFIFANEAFAADRYWVGGAGNWSDDTNHWATISGGAPGAGNKPGASDTAIFDASSGGGTATLNEAVSIAVFDMRTGNTTAVNTSGSNYPLTASGNFTITAGTFTANGSTITVGGSWDSSASTAWTPGLSTVILGGTGSVKQYTTNPWSYGFNNLNLAAAGQTTTLLSGSTWTNKLTVGSGTLTDGINSYSITLQGAGNVFVDGGATLNFDALYFRASSSSTQNIPGRDYSGINTFNFYGTGGVGYIKTYSMQGNITANAIAIGPNNSSGQTAVDVLTTNNYSITATSLNVGNSNNASYGKINAGSSLITINGNVRIYATDSNGNNEINAQTSTWNISGNFTNSDIFTPGTSTVNFTATTTGKTITSNGASFYNLVFNGAGGGWSIQDNLNVNNNFILTQGTFDANTKNVSIAGNFDASGSSTRTITFNSGTWTIAGSRFDTTGTNITRNASNGLVDFTSTTTINTGITSWARLFRNLTLAYPGKTIYLENNLSSDMNLYADGQIRLKGGAITKSGTGVTNPSIYAGYNAPYSTDIIFDAPTSISSSVYIRYLLSTNATWQISAGDFGSVASIYFISYGGTNPKIQLLNNLVATGYIGIIAGNTSTGFVVDFNDNNVNIDSIQFGASWGLVSTQLNAGNGAINLNGVGGIQVNNNSGSHTLDLEGATVNVAGNWKSANGSGLLTVNPGTSTVNLTGGNQIISGTNAFYNLTKSVSSAATLTFPASTTTTINGMLTLNGAASGLLSLIPNPASTIFTIADLGSENVSYVNVQYSTATNSVLAFNSNDSGNNTNWTFNPSPLRYTCGLGNGASAIQAQASATLPTVGVWANVACVMSGTTLSIYVNGVNEGSATFNGTRQTNDNPVYFGQSNANGQWFNGEVDEAALWSRELIPAEIQAFSLMCYDLNPYVKDYLTAIPKDPSSGTDADTGYAISRQSSGVITVQSIAPQSIDNQIPEIKFSR